MLKIPPLGVSLLAVTMAGCSPQCNIAGAYFPAWLACLLAGLFGAWLLQVICLKIGVAAFLRPAPLVYAGAFTSVACLTWLLFFAR